MAAGRETISLSFQAELGDLKRQLETLPGVTKKEAAAMVRELNTGFKQAERAAAKAAKANQRSFSQMADSAKMAGAAIAGAAVSVIALGQAFADLQNELADASARTGVAVETLAGLRLAAEGSGLEFRALEAGLNRLPKAMSDAARGTGAAAQAFEALGVDVHDASGALRDSDVVLRETFEALAAIENPAEKAALAIDLLGQRAGPAFIQSGAIDNLDAFVALATEFGVDVGPKAAASAAEFQRAIATLKTVSQGALYDFVDSIGGPGGINAALEIGLTSVIVFGKVAQSVFATLTEQIGSIVGPLSEVAVELADGDIGGAFRALQRNQDELLSGIAGTNPLVLGYRLVTNAIEDAGEAAVEARRALALLDATTSGGTQRVPGARGGEGAQDASGAPIVADTTEGTDKALQDLQRLRDAQRKASEDRLSERAKIELAYMRERDLIDEAYLSGAELDEVNAARAVSEAERRIALADLEERLHAEKLARIEEERNKTIANISATGDALGALAMLSGSVAEAIASNGTKGARQQAQTFFALQKGLSLAVIPLKLAEALMVAQTQPPPLNALQSATALATAAASTAAIASAKPPTFDMGGIINAGTGDQRIAAVMPGEAVLNRSATAALGPDGVNALNAGRGAPSTIIVEQRYGHRVFDRFVQDNIAAPTPLGNALRADRVAGRR
jgi:hypothetical protein